MTRKEELEKLAADLSGGHYECEDPWYSCPLSPEGCTDDGKGASCTCGATQRQEAIFQVLQRVEREVLERVAKHIGGWRESDPPEEWPLEAWKFIGGERDKLAAWVREQQKELG